MPTGYALAVADRVLAEPFFQTRQTRTVSNTAAWLRGCLTGRSSAATRSDLLAALTEASHEHGHVCDDMPACDHAIELLAADLLRKSCLTPLGYQTISDLPHAADVVSATSVASFAEPVVLTGPRLRQLLDQVPGGAAFYDRVGYAQLRSQLLDDPRFTPADLGVTTLHDAGLLDDESVPAELIDAANRLLVDPTTALIAIRTACATATPAEEVGEFLAFLAACGLDARKVSLPLYLPSRSKVVAALRDLATDQQVVSDLLEVIDPTAHRSRNAAVRKLRDLTFRKLVAASGLPAATEPAHVNRARLSLLLGTAPTAAPLRCYPKLRNLLRGKIGQGTGRSSTQTVELTADTTAGLDTLRDVFTMLSEHHATHGRLPTLAELTDGRLQRLEALAGCTYRELAGRLARDRGWRPPARSRNEQRLDALIHDAYVAPDAAQRAAHVDRVEEWSCRAATGGAWRVDTYVKVTPQIGRPFELFCEADGPGHFTEVRNWDLEACRRRDVDKAAALGSLLGDTRDGLLLAVHHGLLTGPDAVHLDAATLAAVVTEARTAGAWWVFLAPAGSRELRAAPLASSKLDVGLDGIDVWIITARPDPADTRGDDTL